MHRKQSFGKKVVVIISISSDIGLALAKRYARDGYKVIGTYRSSELLSEIKNISDCQLFYCDLSNRESISKFVNDYAKLGIQWDIFISCPCMPLPVQAFFKCNFEEWGDSVHINVIEQLRILHQLHRFRNKKVVSRVVFFAGGGVNKSVINFSAYTASKIMLIKMCEFLDAENNDMSIFIVGPGWTKTKSHYLVLANINKTEQKYRDIQKFLKSDTGTSMDDIYGCIQWLTNQKKIAVSGRNFSVVYDKWKKKNGLNPNRLTKALIHDPNMYKLRRFKNEWGNG